MKNFFEKYWDIVGGIAMALFMVVIDKFQLRKIQICYSIILLILVCIGVLRVIKQSSSNSKKKRKTVIDTIVDGQTAIKAISLSQKNGRFEQIITNFIERSKSIMKKLKVFFDKFKGIALSIALGILTVIEFCGGWLNQVFGEAFTVHGIELLPIITLGSAIVVGILSNGYTKEQKDRIKALFSKSSTNEIVQAEIKKTLKETEHQLKEFKTVLATKQTELDNLNGELETKQNTHSAKVEMANMIPKLATAEDVQIAFIAVKDVKSKIEEKKKEIAEVEKTIANLTSTITALKSQL